MKPHIHAEVIKAWADGAVVQCDATGDWKDITSPAPIWSIQYQYRVKPERVYPKTTMTDEQLYVLMWPDRACSRNNKFWVEVADRVADGAIKQYIKDTENGIQTT